MLLALLSMPPAKLFVGVVDAAVVEVLCTSSIEPVVMS